MTLLRHLGHRSLDIFLISGTGLICIDTDFVITNKLRTNKILYFTGRLQCFWYFVPDCLCRHALPSEGAVTRTLQEATRICVQN